MRSLASASPGAKAHASRPRSVAGDVDHLDCRQSECCMSPENTAGPVLPHRPSKTPPVLRNHREGQVTMFNVTNPVGKDKSRRPKDNIRWPKGNTAETTIVPDPYLAATTWGRCDRPAPVANTFCDASTLAAAWLMGLPRRAGRWLFAVNDARPAGGAGRSWRPSAVSADGTAMPGGTCSRSNPGSAATTSARARTRPRPCDQSTVGMTCTAGRGTAKGNAVRPPRGETDPSLISSLETAVRRVHRPGPVALAWNWRFELAILAAVTGLSIAITGSVGLIGLAAVSGAGLAVGTALLC